MILTFRCKETRRIWDGYCSLRLPSEIQKRALRKLRQLDAARDWNDLKNPPSNHLEALRGDRKEQMSIRISGKWRICFVWRNGDAYDVEIVDYH